MISSSVDFQTFLHPHSMLSFFLLSGFPFCSLLLTQTTTNISDWRYCNPDPSSYSNRLPLMQNTPECYSSDPSSSSSCFDTTLSWVLLRATWPSCWRSGKITTTSQVLLKKINSLQLKTAQKSALYSALSPLVHPSLSPICLTYDLLWTFPLSAHHGLLSSCRLSSFHLPSSIELHPSASLAPPLPCTP